MATQAHKACDHPKTWQARSACRGGLFADKTWREMSTEERRRAIDSGRTLHLERKRDANLTPQAREARRQRNRERKRKPAYRARYRANGGGDSEAYAKHIAHVKANKLKRKHLMATTAVEAIIPEEIFERDEWVCQLCFEDVDPLDFWPHPESASLDHIVPLSLGGSHTEDNVQLAHLFCNVSKGNRIKEEVG